MRMGNYFLRMERDRLFRPYIMHRTIGDLAAIKYFGHRWFILVHILWWEVQFGELA